MLSIPKKPSYLVRLLVRSIRVINLEGIIALSRPVVLMKDSAERGDGGNKLGYSWLDVHTVVEGHHQTRDDDNAITNCYSNRHIDYRRNKTNYSSISGEDGRNDDGGLNDRERGRLLPVDNPMADLRLSSPEHVAIPISYFCVGFLGRYLSTYLPN